MAAGLEGAPIGVEVIVPHGLFDAHAQAHVLPGKGVNGVHKIGIIWRKTVTGGSSLKQRARSIQPYGESKDKVRRRNALFICLILLHIYELTGRRGYNLPPEKFTITFLQ